MPHVVAPAIISRYRKGTDSDATDALIIDEQNARAVPMVGALSTGGAHGNRGFSVAHTLRAEGHDASEDGSGRGTPLIVEGDSAASTPKLPRLRAGCGRGGETVIVVAQCHGSNVGEIGHLRRGSGSVTGGVPFVAQDYANYSFAESDHARPLTGSADRSRAAPIVAAPELAATLSKGGDRKGAKGCAGRRSEDDLNLAASTAAVRRLTPTECERLMGLPDGWTRYTADGAEISDSARYRMIGNGVAVPVVEWIARRIAAVEAMETSA